MTDGLPQHKEAIASREKFTDNMGDCKVCSGRGRDWKRNGVGVLEGVNEEGCYILKYVRTLVSNIGFIGLGLLGVLVEYKISQQSFECLNESVNESSILEST